jgi:restriction system protein
MEQIHVVCPRCNTRYEDWWRASINLQIEQFDDKYLEKASTSTCPMCDFKIRHEALIVRGDGFWQVGSSDDGRGRTDKTMKSQRKVRVHCFQSLSVVRGTLKVYDGVKMSHIDTMTRILNEKRGTPQEQVDWTNPDQWIAVHLDGEFAALAWRFWRESDQRVNPRWLEGPDYLIKVYELTQIDSHGVHRITALGHAFVAQDANAVRQIDDGEGMLKILSLFSARSAAKLGDLLGEWTEYVREHSKFQADSSIRDALRRRLVDLKDRGLVDRDGHTYVITKAGHTYAEGATPPDPKTAALRAIKRFNDEQRDALRTRLSTMSPYLFEKLVGDLLTEMGYEAVQVTKQSGDKGVDVVATVQFGITTVTEVVQVKRQQGNVSRVVLDQLRGALPFHKALRGTIITTGKFSKGCTDAALFHPAAPIGLIDGDRLLDLLFEHHIGIHGRSETLFEVNEAFFDTHPEEENDSDSG